MNGKERERSVGKSARLAPRWVLAIAGQLVPHSHRDRYRLEWEADLSFLPPSERVRWALGLVRASWSLRTSIRRGRSAGSIRAKGLKRLVDVLISAMVLVALAPVLALCALAVRIESGPGALFRQQRVGLGGRVFVMFKFRSLKPLPELELPEALQAR